MPTSPPQYPSLLPPTHSFSKRLKRVHSSLPKVPASYLALISSYTHTSSTTPNCPQALLACMILQLTTSKFEWTKEEHHCTATGYSSTATQKMSTASCTLSTYAPTLNLPWAEPLALSRFVQKRTSSIGLMHASAVPRHQRFTVHHSTVGSTITLR